MNKILFSDQGNDPVKKQGSILNYDELDTDMEVFFEAEDSKIKLGRIVDLFVEGDEETEEEYVVGCLIEDDEFQYERYEENDDNIWAVEIQENSGVTNPVVTVEKKPRKELPNIFAKRSEETSSYAKFPDWDILPPDQFINPRIKN